MPWQTQKVHLRIKYKDIFQVLKLVSLRILLSTILAFLYRRQVMLRASSALRQVRCLITSH